MPGTINGSGQYGFLLMAIDGCVSGGGGQDRLHLKVWDIDAGDAVVYHKEIGSEEAADSTRTAGGGSIVIHSGGNGKRNEGSQRTAPFGMSTRGVLDCPRAAIVISVGWPRPRAVPRGRRGRSMGHLAPTQERTMVPGVSSVNGIGSAAPVVRAHRAPRPQVPESCQHHREAHP